MSIEIIRQHFEQQRFPEAVEVATDLLQSDLQNVRALYWRACAFMKLQEMDKAMIDLNNAIEIFDEYADAFSQRGVIFYHLGQLDLALSDMDTAASLDPKNAYRYSSRAYIKAAQNQLESAIEDYEYAIQLDPEDAVAHNNLGLLQEQLGYKSQAQRNLERAANLAVDHNGTLTDREPVTLPSSEDTGENADTTYLSVLKDIFTTKEGFMGYWKYLKKTLIGK